MLTSLRCIESFEVESTRPCKRNGRLKSVEAIELLSIYYSCNLVCEELWASLGLTDRCYYDVVVVVVVGWSPTQSVNTVYSGSVKNISIQGESD